MTMPPAGWYDDRDGRTQWWDGERWSGQYQGAAAAPSYGPMTHGSLEVKREVSYVRNQTPHSITKHLLFGWMLLWIPTIYYAVSPNHYFRA